VCFVDEPIDPRAAYLERQDISFLPFSFLLLVLGLVLFWAMYFHLFYILIKNKVDSTWNMYVYVQA
jgi:hypothetical protein